MKNLSRFQWLIAAFLFVCLTVIQTQGQNSAGTTAAAAKSAPRSKNHPALTEEFYFLMNDYKMEHQTEVNTLNIKVRYRYIRNITATQYPDFIPIRKDVDKFLTAYPNEMTFWEIVNKELTTMLLEKYPALSEVTCEIQITPSLKYQFTRGSIVTQSRDASGPTVGNSLGSARRLPNKGILRRTP